MIRDFWEEIYKKWTLSIEIEIGTLASCLIVQPVIHWVGRDGNTPARRFRGHSARVKVDG